MYLAGCFIVFLITLLVIHTKGNLTVKDIFISLFCIAISWITLIFCFAVLLIILIGFISESWNTPIWKAKQKSKLCKKLDTILD